MTDEGTTDASAIIGSATDGIATDASTTGATPATDETGTTGTTGTTATTGTTGTTLVATDRRRILPTWITATIAIIAGLVFAFFFWATISRLVSLATIYPAPATPPWGLAAGAIAVPILCFVIAFVVARRRAVGSQLLVYLLGLVTLAALSLSLAGFENMSAGV